MVRLEETKTKLKQVAKSLIILGSVGFVLFAVDASAWGVPGATESGSGSGPGGGSHSGGVPAPFGALFLGMGSLMATWSTPQLIQRLRPAFIFFLTLSVGMALTWIDFTHALCSGCRFSLCASKINRCPPNDSDPF